MGIPSFFSHVIREHGDIFKKYCLSLMSIDNLYLDSNSIIYDVVNEMNTPNNIQNDLQDDRIEEIIIRNVCIKIQEYMNKLKPKNKVFIAFDGVAPVAKLSQQRNRRFKNVFQSEILYEMGINKKKINWETTSITPGTQFMNKLDKTIKKVFEKNKKLHIIISTSTEPGEGEHKIFEYIKNNVEYHKQTTTVIYGLDADLIMLSLNHLHITNKLYLYRETPHFINSIDNSLEPNSDYLLDIPLFAYKLRCMLSQNKKTKDSDNEISDNEISDNEIIFDYIFMCFLLGNDFMPHFPALNIRTDGIQRLLSCYNNMQNNNGSKKRLIHIIYSEDNQNNQIITDTKIIWKNVRELIRLLSMQEEEYILLETQKREKIAVKIKMNGNKQRYQIKHHNSDKGDKDEVKELENRMLSLPLIDRRLEEYIEPTKLGWENRYYKCLFDIDVQTKTTENDDLIKHVCINYLEGLEWTWKYYMHGCIDWEWKYHYHYPPLLIHLLHYIPYFEIDLLKTKKKQPVHEYVQLAYVLPKSSLGLLPKDIERTLLEKHKEWYNYSNKFIWAYCKYFWESHCELPEIDIKLLENIVLSSLSSIQDKNA